MSPRTGAAEAPAFEHDFVFLRACHRDGRSRAPQANGFRWPTEPGGIVEAPDWDPDGTRACGGGLHGLALGIGDWVDSGDKVRVRRCRVLYVGAFAGAMAEIARHLSAGTLSLVRQRVEAATLEGERATGYSGAASATGKAGVALAAGYGCRGMVGEGCLLVLVERDPNTLEIVHYFAAKAGERGVEAGKWYTLRAGEPVEVPG